MRRRAGVLLLTLAALAMIAAACGGDDGGPGPGNEGDAFGGGLNIEAAQEVLALRGVVLEDEAAILYFAEVVVALDRFDSEALRDASRGQASNFDFARLGEAGAGRAYLPVVEALRVIEPPAGYEGDQTLLVAMFEELARIDAEEVGGAIRDEDFAALTEASLALGLSRARGAERLSAKLCFLVLGEEEGAETGAGSRLCGE